MLHRRQPPVAAVAPLVVVADGVLDGQKVALRPHALHQAGAEQYVAHRSDHPAEVEADVPQLTLASPRDSAVRGSQVSFQFEHGYAAMQALIDRDVIGDFRAPDIMRFGFTPLYLDAADVSRAVAVIKDVMDNDLWDNETYKIRARVT